MSTTKPAFKAASLTIPQLLQRSAWYPLLDETARERVLDEIREVEVAAGAAEELRGARRFGHVALLLGHDLGEARHRRGPVVVGALERAGLHLLEAHRERAVHCAAFHGLAREEQRARSA